MAFVPLKLPPGIERNNTPYDTPNRWWDMNQVRWTSGSMVPVGGWTRATSTPLDSALRKIHVWRNNISQVAMLVGTDAKLYADNSGLVDITPSGMVPLTSIGVAGGYGTLGFGQDNFGTARSGPSPVYSPYPYWTMGQWGEDVILTNSADGKLRYYTQSSPTTPPYVIGPSFSNTSAAVVTGSITSGVLSVSAVTSGTLAIGHKITGAGIPGGPPNETVTITSFGTGSGGIGTYNLSDSTLTGIGSETITAYAPTTTGAPAGNSGVLVTAERHVMVFGTNTSPYQVAWCSREDPTDWNFASLTNTAGNLNLTTKSPMLMGVNVKGGVLAFSYTSVFLLQYVGEPFIYDGTDPIASTAMFNPNCVATFGDGQAVWLSRAGFQVYEGGFVQPLPCPVLNDILTGMDPVYGPFRVHASMNGRFPEVTFFYPSTGQIECDRYVSWNYETGVWTWGTQTRSAMAGADAYQFPYMGGSDGNLYQHEEGWLAAGASRVGTIFAETGALQIGAGDRTLDVSQMLIATGAGFGSLTVQAFGRMTPEGTEYAYGPWSPRSDGYTDTRFSARAARLRFTNAIDGPWGLGTIQLDTAPGSGR